MPRKVYMHDQPRSGGGTVFHVPWERIEELLRIDPYTPLERDGEHAQRVPGGPALKHDESCEFVITVTGINVYVHTHDQ